MLLDLSDPSMVVLSSAAWLGASLIVGWRGAHWSAYRVTRTGPITTLRDWEDHGRWWQRHLRVRAWKDSVPEAGSVFGGFAKRRIPSRSTDDLAMFRRETIRAERVHWLILASTPLHLVWCTAELFVFMALFGLVFTVPFIVIQRSNRGRLDRLIERRTRADAVTAVSPAPAPPAPRRPVPAADG